MPKEFTYSQRPPDNRKEFERRYERIFKKLRNDNITAPSPLPYEMKYYNRPKPTEDKK